MKGWKYESNRHALAARGIRSKGSLTSRAIRKERGVDFDIINPDYGFGDLVLSYEEAWSDDCIITDGPNGPDSGPCIYERTHPDGWTIKARIFEEWTRWIENFEAIHPKYGRVWGNFNTIVYADNEEGFNNFYKNHTPHLRDPLDE